MELENLITSERIALEAELTKRWQSDNASDSWLPSIRAHHCVVVGCGAVHLHRP